MAVSCCSCCSCCSRCCPSALTGPQAQCEQHQRRAERTKDRLCGRRPPEKEREKRTCREPVEWPATVSFEPNIADELPAERSRFPSSDSSSTRSSLPRVDVHPLRRSATHTHARAFKFIRSDRFLYGVLVIASVCNMLAAGMLGHARIKYVGKISVMHGLEACWRERHKSAASD